MPGRVGTFAVLAITGAALAFGPSSALGATTVGEDFAPTQPCFTFNSYVQSGSAGNQYAAAGLAGCCMQLPQVLAKEFGTCVTGDGDFLRFRHGN